MLYYDFVGTSYTSLVNNTLSTEIPPSPSQEEEEEVYNLPPLNV